jgi:ketosteroid isomerase-like protein
MDEELLEIESQVMRAIGAKDREALEPLLAAAFVLRAPGQPDVARDQFLKAIAAVPGEILSIEGHDTKAAVAGDAGIVTGLQVATVRLAEDGRVVTSRAAFTDVFTRTNGRWQLALAVSVELPES